MFEKEEIYSQLDKVLKSEAFQRSSRLSEFLRYVVEKSIVGNPDQISGYNIGIDVFNKPSDFNSDNDSTVRVEAMRLRKSLALYYHEKGMNDPIVISIPKGGYTPNFESNDTGRINIFALSKNAVRRVKTISIAFVILFIVSTTIAAYQLEWHTKTRGLFIHSHDIQRPIIAIGSFDVIGFEDNLTVSNKSSLEITKKLAHFSAFKNYIINNNNSLPIQTHDHGVLSTLPVGYILSGTIQKENNTIKVTARLHDAEQDTTTWRFYQAYGDHVDDWYDDVSTRIVSQIASTHGVIDNAEYNKHLNNQKRSRSGYQCHLGFRMYESQKTQEKHRLLKSCLDSLSKRHPDSAITYAYLSWIYSDGLRQGFGEFSEEEQSKQKELALLNAFKAVELDSKDARAHASLANAALLVSEHELSLKHTYVSLSLNPYNTEILISASLKFALMGMWEESITYSRRAYELHPSPPPSYDAVLFTYYYNNNQAEQALHHALGFYQPELPVSYYTLIAAYQSAGQQEKAKEYAESLNQRFPEHTDGFAQKLASWNISNDYLERLMQDLAKSGLDLSTNEIDLSYTVE